MAIGFNVDAIDDKVDLEGQDKLWEKMRQASEQADNDRKLLKLGMDHDERIAEQKLRSFVKKTFCIAGCIIVAGILLGLFILAHSGGAETIESTVDSITNLLFDVAGGIAVWYSRKDKR